VSNALPQYSTYVSSAAPWLGDTPSSWRTLRGKFVFHEIQERSELGDETLLSVSEYYGVKPRGETIEEGEFLSRAESLIGYKKCGVDDLAVNIMLAWKKGLGVSRFSGIVSPSYAVFRFGHVAAPEYMHYLLRTDLYADHFRSRSTGIMDSRLRLYPDSFRDIEILLPSLGEQTQIARFLDYETAKIDRLIDKQQQLIALLKEKRQAVISHAVTKGLNPNAPMKDSGVEWLGQVPAHWDVRTIAKCMDKITNGYVGPTRDILVPVGVPYVQATHIKRGKVNFDDGYFVQTRWSQQHSKSILRSGDVLVVQTGAGTGDIGLVSQQEAGFNCHALIILSARAAEMTGSFLSLVLRSEYGQAVLFSIRTGGMHPHLNCGEVKFVRVPVPSIAEQSDISTHIERQANAFDTLEARALDAVDLLQERRTALISAAVTGKIDVRGWTPPDGDEEAQEAA